MRIDDDPSMRAWEVARDAAQAGTQDQSVSRSRFFAAMADAIRNSPPGDTNAELIRAYTRGGDRGHAEKVTEIVNRGQSSLIRYVHEDNED